MRSFVKQLRGVGFGLSMAAGRGGQREVQWPNMVKQHMQLPLSSSPMLWID